MMKYNDIYMRPSGMNMVEGNGKIWMALLHRNGICEIDIKTREAKICKIFEEEPLDGEYLYCYVEKIGDRLIFSPGLAEKIAIYDLKREIMTYIPLENADKYREVKFWNIITYHSDVYFLAYTYPAILKLSMESMEIEYITDWLEKVGPVDSDNGYFSVGHVMYDDRVLIPVSCMNAVLELNFKTARTRVKRLEVSMSGIGGLSSGDGENIWLVGRGSGANWVSCWNRKTENVKEILLEDVEGNIIDPFWAPVCITSKVYLMPISTSSIYEIDLTTKRIEKFWPFKNIKEPLWGWATMATRLCDDHIMFITGADLRWHEYNMITGISQDYSIHMKEDEEEMKRYFDAVYSGFRKQIYTVILESRLPLECFLDQELNEKSPDKTDHEKSFGKRIYDQVCRI